MASAARAFSEAFSSYSRSVADYLKYSIIIASASLALSFFAAVCLGIFGIVSFGSVASVFASDGSLGFAATGLGASLLALFSALLAIIYLSSGLNGAYIFALHCIISKRKPPLHTFLPLIRKFAARLMLISIISGVLIGVPLAFALSAAPALGQALFVAVLLLAAAYAAALSFLLVFAVPCAVVDGRGPISAMKISAMATLRNPVQVLIFFAVAVALAVPGTVPIFSLAYLPLFYMPMVTSALLRLYRDVGKGASAA